MQLNSKGESSRWMLQGELCSPKFCMLKPYPPQTQNVIVFGDKTFKVIKVKEVIRVGPNPI